MEDQENTLLQDGEGVIELGHHRYLAWVSFLDGMQRVLLFTEDPGLCFSLAHTTGEHERIAQVRNMPMVSPFFVVSSVFRHIKYLFVLICVIVFFPLLFRQAQVLFHKLGIEQVRHSS